MPYAIVIEKGPRNSSAYVPNLPGCVFDRRHARRRSVRNPRGDRISPRTDAGGRRRNPGAEFWARKTPTVLHMTLYAKSVRFEKSSTRVEGTDGRALGVPLAGYPRGLNATPEQRERVSIGRRGLHGEDLDEDIRIAGLPAGRVDRTKWGRRSVTEA